MLRILLPSFLLPFFVICCISSTYGQVDSTLLQISVNWKKGERRQYVQDYIKRTWNRDSLESHQQYKTLISFEVLDSTVNGYLIAYKIDSVLYDNIQPEQTVASYISTILNQMVYQFRTNEHGEFLDLENWEALQDQFIDLIERNLAAEGEVLSVEKRQTRDMLYSLVDSKEQLEDLLLRRVLCLFNSYGKAYRDDQWYEYDDELPNPYQGSELTAYGQWKAWQDKKGRLRYKDERITDEDDGQYYLLDMLTHMLEQMNLPIGERIRQKQALRQDMGDFTYSIADFNDLTFQKDSGWVASGAYKRILMTVYLNTKTVREEYRRFQLLR
ncbi:MAG: hypothetical protein AAGG75_15670 [Bacteroidota bacterium]